MRRIAWFATTATFLRGHVGSRSVRVGVPDAVRDRRLRGSRSIDTTAIAAAALIVSWCKGLGSQVHDGPVLANRTTSSALTGRSRKAGLAIRQARHARQTASRFHRLEVVDEAGNHVETLVPERRISGIEAEWRKKLLVVP